MVDLVRYRTSRREPITETIVTISLATPALTNSDDEPPTQNNTISLSFCATL
jgi:hypothetical protein